VRWLAALAVVVWLALALSPAARAHLLTALLLPELLNIGARPLTLVSGAPAREEIALAGAAGDLYRPAVGGRHGAVVLTLGVHPLDKREPVVASLAEGLARVGLAVLVVQSEALMADRIEPTEPGRLVAAFERLAVEPGVVPERIGLVGFSAGASLSFLAATDQRIAERVRLVSWLGGYADAVRLVEEVQTASAAGEPWEPYPLSRYVFRKQLVEGIADAADRARLEDAYVQEFGAGDPAARAALEADPSALGAEARHLVALFSTSDAEEVARLAGALPSAMRGRLDALSPIRRVDEFRARAYVMVDTADPLVPYGHSRELAARLPPERLARYVEFEIFEHVQPTKPVPLTTFVDDAWRLYLTIAAILLQLDPSAG
jgi:pimeloyl-ACP methyl ester carboxylesterase